MVVVRQIAFREARARKGVESEKVNYVSLHLLFNDVDPVGFGHSAGEGKLKGSVQCFMITERAEEPIWGSLVVSRCALPHRRQGYGGEQPLRVSLPWRGCLFCVHYLVSSAELIGCLSTGAMFDE